MLPDMVGAVIYVRVSTKEQPKNLSLPTLLKACGEYCERQGFKVLARFRDKARARDALHTERLLKSSAGGTGAPSSGRLIGSVASQTLHLNLI
jgi:hypothetical protein